MARTVDHARRTQLLDRVVGYLGRHGLTDVSLRPMARALGVSVNSLVHHFGSKDELIAAALLRSGEVQVAIEREWRVQQPNLTVVELLRRWWRWVTESPDHLAIVRLGIEAVTLERELGRLGPRERGQQIEFWRLQFQTAFVAAGVEPAAAADEATLVKATFTGLVLDLVATGETARTTRSFERFLVDVERLVAEHQDGERRSFDHHVANRLARAASN